MDTILRYGPVRLAIAGAAAGLTAAALGWAALAYVEWRWKRATGWTD